MNNVLTSINVTLSYMCPDMINRDPQHAMIYVIASWQFMYIRLTRNTLLIDFYQQIQRAAV